MPRVLRSAFLAPIYKDKGDETDPSNYRPIALTSASRRIISDALNREVSSATTGQNAKQWSFQIGSNTECAIAFAVNNLQRGFPSAAILDLRKAYDMVPRDLLDEIIRQQLPPQLANMVRGLLCPMLLQTKGQAGDTTLITMAGVPQGDPASPALFNMFMDVYLQQTNQAPSQGIASCFANDVLLLAKDTTSLGKLLDTSTTWAQQYGMILAVNKSQILRGDQSPVLHLHHQTLPSAPTGTYLGISLNATGIGDVKAVF